MVEKENQRMGFKNFIVIKLKHEIKLTLHIYNKIFKD